MQRMGTPAGLNERQRAVYDAIVSGPRGRDSPFPLAAEDGSLNGPFGLMVRFPEWGDSLQRLGSSLRFASSLPDRVREIVILVVGSEMRSEFEIQAHTAAGRSAGLQDAEIDAILRDRFESSDEREAAAVRLARSLLRGTNTDPTPLDDAQTADVVVLVGYYRLLAQLMTQFGIGASDDWSVRQRHVQGDRKARTPKDG